ncbi:class D beta-lactamase [Maritalea sp. S77]|uniref:class D beta-lactamase n=1 Tax=Maritalea sp. S77 TaxID=3415125 RepID=UPI003C7A8E89
MRFKRATLFILATSFWAPSAYAGHICTLIADPVKNVILTEKGKCDDRVTPASTFKLALAIMAFDHGILKDPHTPKWAFKQGYAAWGGKNWQRETDPTDWLTYSVVWYSQLIAKEMGAEKLTNYAHDFRYGNGDFSGDPGKNNGLERAWIASSLAISPREQLQFIARYINRNLPVSEAAYAHSRAAMPTQMVNGWQVFGKTGMAYPRLKNGALDRAHPYGWYVGWAEKGNQRRIFVRLRQDDQKMEGSASTRAKSGVMTDLIPYLPD